MTIGLMTGASGRSRFLLEDATDFKKNWTSNSSNPCLDHHDILRPPGDSKIISLNDSDDDVEEQEEKLSISNPASADDAPASANDAPTSADEAPAEARISNSDDQGPDEEADGSDNGGRSAGDP
jgi:hypothetical protein